MKKAKQESSVSHLHYQGLSAAQVEESRRKHGSNFMLPPERDPWWRQYLEKFDDPVIRILLIAAVIATGMGFVDGHFVEGIGIIIAVFLATTLAFVNEFRANQEFDILNQINEEVLVQVIRDGRYQTVPRRDLVVDDVVVVELGEEIPADAKVLEGVSFLVDEAKLTGESHPVVKRPQQEGTPQGEATYPQDVVLRGTLVSDGHAVLRVTAVGERTEVGMTAKAASEESTEPSPLNQQLERLAKLIGVVGFVFAFFIFVALSVRGYLRQELVLSSIQWTLTGILFVGVLVAFVRVWLPVYYDAYEVAGKDVQVPDWLEQGGLWAWLKVILLGGAIIVLGVACLRWTGSLPSEPAKWLPSGVGREFLQYFMISVTIIVVAVPEGLAMSVTLSLAYSMRKMTRTNNLVRRMVACETIGAATVICSDKTGTLTQNKMRVEHTVFPLQPDAQKKTQGGWRPTELIVEAVAANSTANLSHEKEGDSPVVIGNPTESALLLWLDQHGVDYLAARDKFVVRKQLTFSTERKYMATAGQSATLQTGVLHVKGAPEIVLEHATHTLGAKGEEPLTAARKKEILQQIKEYATRGMRTLALAYRRLGALDSIGEDASALTQHVEQLVWLGFVALVDPIRPEVPASIQLCREAGIAVKIVTGDSPETAKEVARSIGLLLDDAKANHLTGAEFEALSDKQALEAIDTLQVLSRARPLHKLRLVRLLQEKGHVVAVTGDGSNDAPALNSAQVGLAMGKTGTAVAKEASDIILLDDSFRSIASAVLWGRSLYLNIQKFILFQLTINVTALVIALLGPFMNVKLPLTVVQMLWINLIMDTFAALALATEPPDESLMHRPPRRAEDFIITPRMAWEIMITGVSFVVVLVGLLLYLQQGGLTRYEESYFFTAFVLLQFWNLFNARVFGTNRSAFSQFAANPSFLIIAAAIFVGQVIIVHLGGNAFRTVALSTQDWLILIGVSSLVLWFGELRRWLSSRQTSQPA